MQGVIDCYFEEADGIVLLDYKTDYVAPGSVDKIRERYQVQISYYARALEKLTGKRVKEKMIYLFWAYQKVYVCGCISATKAYAKDLAQAKSSF